MEVDIHEIEQLISNANESRTNKAASIEKLHSLKLHQNRLLLGLQLFLKGSNEQTQFFGLSLIRECLKILSLQNEELSQRTILRDNLIAFLEAEGSRIVPNYILKSILSILTLLIKIDYPENWPSAFETILRLSGHDSPSSRFILITILEEFEVEIVAFSDIRSKEEMNHNILIKDTMRSTGLTFLLTEYLCQIIAETLQKLINKDILDPPSSNLKLNEQLAKQSLLRLSELIAWIDISIILQAIPIVYKSISCSTLQVEGLGCIRELARKGMILSVRFDSFAKLDLVSFLFSLPICTETRKMLMKSDISESEYEPQIQFSRIVDLIFLDFIAYALSYEDNFFPLKNDSMQTTPEITSRKTNNSFNSEMQSYFPFVQQNLHMLMKLLLRILRNGSVGVVSSVFGSVQKFHFFLKQQLSRKLNEKYVAFTTSSSSDYFFCGQYLSDMLSCLLSQAVYPDGMTFIEGEQIDEELQLLVEEKREIRRLFLQFAKLNPNEALSHLMSLLQQERPSGIQYEAVFRLLQSFTDFEKEDDQRFVDLVVQVQKMDVQFLQHVESQIAFYEFWVKFQRFANLEGKMLVVLKLLQSLLNPPDSGSNQYVAEIQIKFAQCLIKLLDAMGDDRSMLFSNTKDIVTKLISKSVNFNERMFKSSIPSATSRLRLKSPDDQLNVLIFEVAGMFIHQKNVTDLPLIAAQSAFFAEILVYLFNINEKVLSITTTLSSGETNQELIESALLRILSSIAALLKHLPKSSLGNNELALQVVNALLQQLLHNPFCQQSERIRTRIVTVLHFYLTSGNPEILNRFLPQLLYILQTTVSIQEMESLVQLINQITTIYPLELILSFYQDNFQTMITNCVRFNAALEERLRLSLQTNLVEHEITAIQNDRILSLRLIFSFLQQIISVQLDYYLLANDASLRLILTFVVDVFNELSPSHQLLQKNGCVQLKRCCCLVVNGLICNWIIPHHLDSQNAAFQSVAHVLNSFLYEKWIPLILVNIAPVFLYHSQSSEILIKLVQDSLSPSFPATLLNIRDAASQSVITEIACTFYYLFFNSSGSGSGQRAIPSSSNDAFISYLSNTLQQLNWQNDHQLRFLQLFQMPDGLDSLTLPTFKELFKKFVRSIPS